MATASVTIEGITDLVRVLYDLRFVLGRGGELGKTYSKGANQGHGNYEHWVQSAERQTWFHRRTGWHTDLMAVKEFETKVQGMLDSAFNELGRSPALTLLRKFTDDLLNQILEYMQDYPPVPAGSTYIRTYTLHDSWDVELNL